MIWRAEGGYGHLRIVTAWTCMTEESGDSSYQTLRGVSMLACTFGSERSIIYISYVDTVVASCTVILFSALTGALPTAGVRALQFLQFLQLHFSQNGLQQHF